MLKKWQSLQKKVRKKGNERLTFMIIPHNESHIFNLQLSKFTIAFAILITITVVLTSGLSVKLQQNIKQEAAELYSAESSFDTERQYYQEHLTTFKARHKLFRKNLISIMQKTELVTNEDSPFRNDNTLEKVAENQLTKESDMYTYQLRAAAAKQGSSTTLGQISEKLLTPKDIDPNDKIVYSSEVVELRTLRLSLQETIAALGSFKDFVQERENVQKSLPYAWPLAGGHFTSFYGPRISPFGYSRSFHTGVDIAETLGTPVYAAADGTVINSGYSGGYGLMVKLNHRFGYMSLYGHMSSIYVYAGQAIKKGQMLGRVGSTGHSTGPHLHFEVRVLDQHTDPMPYLTSL